MSCANSIAPLGKGLEQRALAIRVCSSSSAHAPTGASPRSQGKGRGFALIGGNLETIRVPRRKQVCRQAAQFRCILRKKAAASFIEENSSRKGSSQQFWCQKTSVAGGAGSCSRLPICKISVLGFRSSARRWLSKFGMGWYTRPGSATRLMCDYTPMGVKMSGSTAILLARNFAVNIFARFRSKPAGKTGCVVWRIGMRFFRSR